MISSPSEPSSLLPLLIPIGLAFFKGEIKFYWLAIRERGKLKIWRRKHPSLPHIQQIQSEGTDSWSLIRVSHWIIDTSKQDNGVYVEYLNRGRIIAKGKIPWDKWASMLKRDPVFPPEVARGAAPSS